MSYRSLLSPTALSCLLVLTACSPEGTGGGGPTSSPSGDAGPSSSGPGTGGNTGGNDTGGNDTGGNDTGGGDWGTGGGGGSGGDPTDAGTTPVDTGPLEEGTDAHIDDTCNPDVFAGFMITIFDNVTTCENRFPDGGDFLQLRIGEPSLAPRPEGRTYTVLVPNTEDHGILGYPNEGEAEGSFSGHASGDGSSRAESGTITIVADDSEKFHGSYDVTLMDGSRKMGTFTSDRCAPQPGDCE